MTGAFGATSLGFFEEGEGQLTRSSEIPRAMLVVNCERFNGDPSQIAEPAVPHGTRRRELDELAPHGCGIGEPPLTTKPDSEEKQCLGPDYGLGRFGRVPITRLRSREVLRSFEDLSKRERFRTITTRLTPFARQLHCACGYRSERDQVDPVVFEHGLERPRIS